MQDLQFDEYELNLHGSSSIVSGGGDDGTSMSSTPPAAAPLSFSRSASVGCNITNGVGKLTSLASVGRANTIDGGYTTAAAVVGGGVASTPSWMTEQRQKRQNRRGYGRRGSIGGGANSTVKSGRSSRTPLFSGRYTSGGCSGGGMSRFDVDMEGEEMDFDEGGVDDNRTSAFLDTRADARLEGNSSRSSSSRRASLRVAREATDGENRGTSNTINTTSIDGDDDILDSSANARLKGNNSGRSSTTTMHNNNASKTRGSAVKKTSRRLRRSLRSMGDLEEGGVRVGGGYGDAAAADSRASSSQHQQHLKNNDDDAVMVSKPKKKRPNLPRGPNSRPPLPTASSNATSSLAAAAVASSVSTAPTSTPCNYSRSFSEDNVRRSIFTPKADLNSCEFDFTDGNEEEEEENDMVRGFQEEQFNQQSKQRQKQHLEDANSNESSVIRTRGVVKGSKFLFRRTQSAVATSSSSSIAMASSLAAVTTPLLEESVPLRRASSTTPAASSLSSNNSSSNNKVDAPATRSRRQTNPKKRTTAALTADSGYSSDDFQSDLKPSPPKIAARSSSVASFSSTSFSSSGNTTSTVGSTNGGGCESFSSIARSGSNSWGTNRHKRSYSVQSFQNRGGGAMKTPSNSYVHQRAFTFTADFSDMKSVGSSSSFFSPESLHSAATPRKKLGSELLEDDDDDEEEDLDIEYVAKRRNPSFGSSVSGGCNSFGSEKGDLLDSSLRSQSKIFSPPTIDDAAPSFTGNSLFSPPFGGSLNAELSIDVNENEFTDGRKDTTRGDLESDNESMASVASDDASAHSTTSSDEDSEEEEAPKEMTDAEIFESKSSYEDFKFLTKSLLKWSQTSCAKGASMGLNNGCLIAVPATWTFEHRNSFAKWSVVAFGFRVGSVGGAGGSFLRCNDAEGNEALAKLRRILKDHKSGNLVSSTVKKEEAKEETILFSPSTENELSVAK